MKHIELIEKHFKISQLQKQQFSQLPDLYKSWNEKINVVSRKDVDNLMVHHVLHSLSIAKFVSFIDGAEILDIGTGGGFPGIPLAIMFPGANFTLVDSISKKINVVKAISESIQLNNVAALSIRAEQVNGTFDFAVSRATAPLTDLEKWSRGKIKKVSKHTLYNGIICLKGGDLTDEIKPFKNKVSLVPVNQYFSYDFFDTKFVVHLPVL